MEEQEKSQNYYGVFVRAFMLYAPKEEVMAIFENYCKHYENQPSLLSAEQPDLIPLSRLFRKIFGDRLHNVKIPGKSYSGLWDKYLSILSEYNNDGLWAIITLAEAQEMYDFAIDIFRIHGLKYFFIMQLKALKEDAEKEKTQRAEQNTTRHTLTGKDDGERQNSQATSLPETTPPLANEAIQEEIQRPPLKERKPYTRRTPEERAAAKLAVKEPKRSGRPLGSKNKNLTSEEIKPSNT